MTRVQVGRDRLKNVVRSLLASVGYEIRRANPFGTTEIRTTMAEVLHHTKQLGFLPSTVFDVGVGRGTEELYRTFPDAKHILIEPVREFEPYLQGICSRYNAEYLIAAASDCDGDVTIHMHDKHLEGSSLLEGQSGSGPLRAVRGVRIDSLCSQKGWPPPYLIKVDVQAGELLVLNGAQRVLAESELVILETSLFAFRSGAHEFSDVVDYMRRRGFVPYDIFGARNRPYDRALAQVDVAFVKECGFLRSTHLWATPEQSSKMEHAFPGDVHGSRI